MEHIICTNIIVNEFDLPRFPVKVFARKNWLYAVCIGDGDFTQQLIEKGFTVQHGSSECAEQIEAYLRKS
jgi:hypothetical protein